MNDVAGVFSRVLLVCLLTCASGCSTDPTGLPETLGSLRLQEWIGGEEARELINQIHHKGVSPGEDFVGQYVGEEGTATLYFSVFENASEAAVMMERMTTGIEKSRFPFTDLKDHPVSPGKKINMCLGLDQAHFFFPDGRRLYWLSVDVPIAESTLAHLLAATAQ